jgi:hypothetical protein
MLTVDVSGTGRPPRFPLYGMRAGAEVLDISLVGSNPTVHTELELETLGV